MRVSDRVLDDLEPIVEMYALGHPIDWDAQMAIMPTPDGQTMIGVQFFFFMRSPILGTGDLAMIQFMPRFASYSGEPGSGGKCTMAMMGFTLPKVSLIMMNS